MMQTLYYSTSNIVCRRSNVLDFTRYSRRMSAARGALCADGGGVSPVRDAPAPVRIDFPAPDRAEWDASARSASHPAGIGTSMPRRARGRELCLDLWASMGVLVMTAAFTLRVLIF